MCNRILDKEMSFSTSTKTHVFAELQMYPGDSTPSASVEDFAQHISNNSILFSKIKVKGNDECQYAVSYTHLTLPTKLSV